MGGGWGTGIYFKGGVAGGTGRQSGRPRRGERGRGQARRVTLLTNQLGSVYAIQSLVEESLDFKLVI